MKVSPLVSVVLITYNQESFIEESVTSVLEQTYQNIELIVVDDGSTDKTLLLLKAMHDPRLRVIYKSNGGPSSSLNSGIAKAQGDFIAIMAGDDVSDKRRIEKQLQEFESGNFNKFIFSECDFIDSKGIRTTGVHTSIREMKLQKRTDYIRKFFDIGNFLCAPSAFGPTDIFRRLGFFDPFLLQLQDFDYWLRAAISGVDFVVLCDKLIKYRLRDDFGNLSTVTPESKIRTDYELFLVLRNFLNLSIEDARSVFSEYYSRSADASVELTIANACINHDNHIWRSFGLDNLYRFSKKSSSISELLSPKLFSSTIIDVNYFQYNYEKSKLYINSGNGFSENQVVTSMINTDIGPFTQVFNVEIYPIIESIRYDFVERSMVTLRLCLVSIFDKTGNVLRLDISSLITNGTVLCNGDITFFNNDPQIILPLGISANKVIIKGERIPFDLNLLRVAKFLTKEKADYCDAVQDTDKINNQDNAYYINYLCSFMCLKKGSLLVLSNQYLRLYQNKIIISIFNLIISLIRFFSKIMKKLSHE